MNTTQMTVAQYKALLKGAGNIKGEKEEPDRKPPAPNKRQEKSNHTPDTRRVKEINAAVRTLLARVSPLCYARGWKIDTARHFTTDPRDADFPSHRDDAATPNCLVIWRETGRVETLLWLWEEDVSDEEVVQRLERLEVRPC